MRQALPGYVLPAIALLLAFGCGCRGAGTVAASSADRADWSPPPEVDPEIVAANTGFSLGLFRELVREEGAGNVFVSPASIALALSMTYNGASGDTAEAMAKALEVEGISLDDLNRGHAALMANLQSPDPNVRLTIANSLWGRQGTAFAPKFLDANRQFYGASVQSLDLVSPSAARTINDWVAKATEGRIEEIVSSRIDPNTVLLLIDAVYFRGQWHEPFAKQQTKEAPFTSLGGRTKTVPMMEQEGAYPYLETPHFQAIALAYGQERVRMVILLPRLSSSIGVHDLAAGLKKGWEEWTAGLTPRQGTIKLPRFSVEYDGQLKAALTAMGMGVAFDPGGADFAAMGAPGRGAWWVDDVHHRAILRVDEEGSEAAAVTEVRVEMQARMPRAPGQPFTMVVDRPFICAIWDSRTKAILFIGLIIEP